MPGNDTIPKGLERKGYIGVSMPKYLLRIIREFEKDGTIMNRSRWICHLVRNELKKEHPDSWREYYAKILKKGDKQ